MPIESGVKNRKMSGDSLGLATPLISLIYGNSTVLAANVSWFAVKCRQSKNSTNEIGGLRLRGEGTAELG
jgi:hypothetical protein